MALFAKRSRDPRDSNAAYGPSAVRSGAGWSCPDYPGAVIPMVPLHSSPLPQRLEGQDTKQYALPQPIELQYQTYWRGNQVPIATIQTLPHVQWVHFRTQDQVVPQRKQGSFTINLSQVGSANVMARWHDLWTRLAGGS